MIKALLTGYRLGKIAGVGKMLKEKA